MADTPQVRVAIKADDAGLQAAVTRSTAALKGLEVNTSRLSSVAATATGALGKIGGPLRELATSTLGVQGGFGAVAQTLLSSFGAGGLVVTGVAAGALAIGFAMKRITGDMEEVKAAADRAAAAIARAVGVDTQALRDRQTLQEQRTRLQGAIQNLQNGGVTLGGSPEAALLDRLFGTSFSGRSREQQISDGLDQLAAIDVQIESINRKLAQTPAIELKRTAAALRTAEAYTAQERAVFSAEEAADRLRRARAAQRGGLGATLTGPGAAPLLDINADVERAVGETLRKPLFALQEELDAGVAGLTERFRLAIIDSLVNGLAAGFDAFFQTGSIGQGFKALAGALLGGLGSAMSEFGRGLIQLGLKMQIAIAAAKSLNPLAVIGAGVALVALGSALGGVARNAFGGGGAGVAGGSVTGSASVSSVASATQAGPITYVVPRELGLNPNDPVVHDWFAETLAAATGRRVIVEMR